MAGAAAGESVTALAEGIPITDVSRWLGHKSIEAFANRLLNIAAFNFINPGAAVLANVGGVTTNGIDIAGTLRFGSHFSVYDAVSYNRSTYDSNYITGAANSVYATTYLPFEAYIAAAVIYLALTFMLVAVLHLIGIGLGLAIGRTGQGRQLAQLSGAAISLAGIVLLVSP